MPIRGTFISEGTLPEVNINYHHIIHCHIGTKCIIVALAMLVTIHYDYQPLPLFCLITLINHLHINHHDDPKYEGLNMGDEPNPASLPWRRLQGRLRMHSMSRFSSLSSI